MLIFLTTLFSALSSILRSRATWASGCDGLAFSRMSLLSNPQCVQLLLEGATMDYLGCWTLVTCSSVVCLRVLLLCFEVVPV